MNHLHNALRKCSCQHGLAWSGYLLPKEVLALHSAGVEINAHDLKLAIYRKQQGHTVGHWTYFDMIESLKDLN